MALVIQRKVGEGITIGDAVIIIKSINGKYAKVLIEAPREINISRVDHDDKSHQRLCGAKMEVEDMIPIME